MKRDHRSFAAATGLLVAASLHSAFGLAQSTAKDELTALKNEIQAIKETQALRNQVRTLTDGDAVIRRDVQEIKGLVQQMRAAPAPLGTAPAAAPSPAQPKDLVLATAGSAVKGNKDAKFAVVEFTDYQCPFCGNYAKETLPEIDKEYIKTGKIKYVLRDFPLERVHFNAFKAAQAAHCAGEQDKYWEMHDRFFANQATLAANDLPAHAAALGLDVAKFKQCLDTEKYAKAVRQHMADGERARLTMTPTFYLGIAQPNGSVKVVKTLRGSQPYAAFKDALEELMATP